MRRILTLLICVFIPFLVIAQVQTYIQKGIVRSQSFVNKNGKRIVGAIIMRSGNNVDPVISVEFPEKGYFELPMERSNSKVYYISSVKGPKGTHYKVLYPQPNEKLEFTSNAPLTIIMQSNRELDEYALHVKSQATKEAKKRFVKEKKRLELECLRGHITEIRKDSIIAALQSKLDNYNEIIYDYIRKNLQEKDFETLDARQQKICIAMENGDYVRLDSLLNWRTNEERRAEYLKSQEEVKLVRQWAEEKNKEYEKKIQNILFEKDYMIQSALDQLNFSKAIHEMKDRLFYDSTNVDYLCQLGELLEIHYNSYSQALEYYQRALSASKLKDFSDNAVCHNHLGNVYSALSDYVLAEKHYNHACQLLENQKGNMGKEVYDTYLGLGNLYYDQAKFVEALSYYKKCSLPNVASINRKSFWQGRMGIGKVMLVKGDYQEAKIEFSSVIKEILLKPQVDIVTLSMAYSCMIECMMTIGHYQEAIDSCNVAINLIQRQSSIKNTYIADLLIYKGKAYINIGKIKEGKLIMNEAIDVYKRILGVNHPNYAKACLHFADYYELIGDLKESERMSDRALELLNKKFGKNHLATISAHVSKCNLYQAYAEYGKAQEELDLIRDILKSSDLLNDYNLILIKCTEAAIRVAQGEQPKGVKLFLEAIECITKTLGRESVQLINIYNQIAMVYLKQLDNEKAKNFLEKAQYLSNKIFGNGSSTAMMQKMGMGQYFVNCGEYHKAFELYSKIERSAVETFGINNYQLCNIYSMLGDYHLLQYQYDKAKYYYDKIYEITKKTYSEKHYFIANPLNKIGAYYMKIGSFQKGLEYAQSAYNILLNHFGIGHKNTLRPQLDLCSVYIQLGEYSQAEVILAELSNLVEKNFGKKHVLYSDVLKIEANLHQSKGNFGNAIECVKESLNIVENIYGPCHFNTLGLYETLGEIFSKLCNFSMAIKYNDIAISIANRYYGKENVGVMPYLLNKGILCANFNRIRESHEIYDKVKSVYISHFGDSCKQLISVMISDAQLLMQEGYVEEALNNLKAVEKQMLSIYGENSVQMCGLYNTLADAYQCVMQYKEAKFYYMKSIKIIKENLGKDNVNSINPLFGLGNVCISEDATGQQIEEAYHLFRQASFISTMVYGANSFQTTRIDVMLGQISLRQMKLQDAYSKFRKYDMSVRQALGDSVGIHDRIADSYMNMGYYYSAKAVEASNRQDFVKSRQFLLQAKDEFEKSQVIKEKIFGKEYAGIAVNLNAIAQIYFMLQCPDSAIATYMKALELTIKQFGKQSPLVAQSYAMLGAACKYESDQKFDEEKLNKAKMYYLKAITIRENSKGISRENIMTSTMDWRINLSSIYMKQSNYESAFRIIDKIIKELEDLNLDNKNALYNCFCTKVGMIVESERNLEDALILLFKAEELFPLLIFQNKIIKDQQHFQLFYSFAVVYEKKGLIGDSIKNYESALEKLKEIPHNPQMNQILKDKIEQLKKKL